MRVCFDSRKRGPTRKGVGLFVRKLVAGMPLLPVEEEGGLKDPLVRKNFIERVFKYRRLKELLDSGCRRGDLVAFQTDHKLLLNTYSPRHLEQLGRLLEVPARRSGQRLSEMDGEEFMEALRIPAGSKRISTSRSALRMS